MEKIFCGKIYYKIWGLLIIVIKKKIWGNVANILAIHYFLYYKKFSGKKYYKYIRLLIFPNIKKFLGKNAYIIYGLSIISK